MPRGTQAAVAQLAVPVVPFVCFVPIVGDDSLPSAGVAASVRLFVSPVKPVMSQVGADELVAVSDVTASRVVFLPKKASPPSASPKTSHSAVFQWGARSNLESLPGGHGRDPAVDQRHLVATAGLGAPGERERRQALGPRGSLTGQAILE
jgi:hypothetical protein